MKAYLFLSLAIISEVIATLTLEQTNEFKSLMPSVIVVAGYMTAFYFLTLTLKYMPIGVAYAIWSGIGITIITLVGNIFYKEQLDTATLTGIGLIVLGVTIVNFKSDA